MKRIMSEKLIPVVKIFAYVLLLAFFLVRPSSSEVVDRIVAVVNDEIITLSDLNKRFAPYIAKIRSFNYPMEKQRKLLYEAREQVLEQMIVERLTEQQARRLGFRVREKEIDSAIERIKKMNSMTDEDFRRQLEREGLNYEAYRKKIRDDILRARLVNREVKSKIVITREDARKYYDDHSDQYMKKAVYHLRNIVKMLPPDPAGAAEAKRKMKEILKRLDSGESFQELAQTFSEGSNAKQGGDLGLLSADTLRPEIKKAIAGLERGQHTDILQIDQALQVIFVENFIPSEKKSFEEVEAEIEDILYKQAIADRFKEWIDDLKRRSHIKIIR